MNHKKIIIFIALYHAALLGKPPLQLALGFYASFQKEGIYELCPLRGIVGNESGLLKNRWLFGNKNHATIQLLRMLFKVEEDEELLMTTYAPYNKFTIKTLSYLIAYAYNQTLYLKDEQNQYQVLKPLCTTFQGNKSPQRLQKLLNLIELSQEEERQNLYPYGTTYQILLSFLYQKSNDIEDLKNYMHELSKLLSKDLKHEPAEELDIYTPTTPLSSNEINQWLPQVFEKVILQKALMRTYQQNRPPNLQWARGVTYKKNQTISDCCETAIRKFINELAYDAAKKEFNLQQFPKKLFKNMPENMKKFYSTYNKARTLQEIDNATIHTHWMCNVSNLSDVQYRKGTYEIHPSLTNIFAILSTLCGIKKLQYNSKNTTSYLNAFCKRLSKGEFFTINFINISQNNDTDTDLVFKISHIAPEYSYPHYITMHIRTDHAWLTQNQEQAMPSPFSSYRSLYEKKPENLTSELLDLSTMFASNVDLACIPDYKESPILKTILFAHPTTSETEKYLCIKKLIDLYNTTQRGSYLRFCLELTDSLYSSESKAYALVNLIERDAHTSSVKGTLISKLPRLKKHDQKLCIMALLHKKLCNDRDYKDSINTALPALDKPFDATLFPKKPLQIELYKATES